MDELTRERFGETLPEAELWRRPGPRPVLMTRKQPWPTPQQLRRQQELLKALTRRED